MTCAICSCFTIDTAGQIVHRPGCPVAYTVGLVVPAPGVGPLPAGNVTVLRECAAHPGIVLDACPACLTAASILLRECVEEIRRALNEDSSEVLIMWRVDARRRLLAVSEKAAAFGIVPEDKR